MTEEEVKAVVAEGAQHGRGDHGHTLLLHAARRHALVLGFDHDGDGVVSRVYAGDLGGQPPGDRTEPLHGGVARPRRKGIYVLPNMITLAALFGGFQERQPTGGIVPLALLASQA